MTREKVTYTKDAHGRRALVAEDRALRLYPDPNGPEQKAAQWMPITPEQRDALVAAASSKEIVEYDPQESAKYGRPIWFDAPSLDDAVS